MAVVLSLVVMACIKVDFSCVFAAKLFDNIQFVTFRLPAFFIGYMLAPYAKEDKSVSLVWMLIIPLIVVAAMRFLTFWLLARIFGSAISCFFMLYSKTYWMCCS